VAVDGNVTAGTQKQAKCALLFLYRIVLGRELGFLDVGRFSRDSSQDLTLDIEMIS
jgi:hypothetical protein